MIPVAKLRRKPRHFQSFTGLSVAEFDPLLAQGAPVYEADQHNRRQRDDRLRQPGAGRPFALCLPERLLLGWMSLRLYLGQNLLAYRFDLDQSNVCRELHDRLLPLWLEGLPVPLREAPLRHLAQNTAEGSGQNGTPPGKKRRRINTLQELREAYPESEEVLLDATEQSVPQPEDKAERKLRSSGKQQDPTIKTQIVATRPLILPVFGGLPGSLADPTLLGASGGIPPVPPHVKLRVDKGYAGTDKRYRDRAVAQPVKGQRNHTVTGLGRAYTYLLSTQRIDVEHHCARLQKFGLLRDGYRGRFAGHEDIFCSVSGLLNFRATGKFSLA